MDMNRFAKETFLSSKVNSLLEVELSLDVDEKVFERCWDPLDKEVSTMDCGAKDLNIAWALGWTISKCSVKREDMVVKSEVR